MFHVHKIYPCFSGRIILILLQIISVLLEYIFLWIYFLSKISLSSIYTCCFISGLLSTKVIEKEKVGLQKGGFYCLEIILQSPSPILRISEYEICRKFKRKKTKTAGNHTSIKYSSLLAVLSF